MVKQKSILHVLKWSTFGTIVPLVVNPLITIYIARLLTPEVYGLVAIATIITSFLQLLLTTGFTSALIQKQGTQSEINRVGDFIFTFNLLLCTIFYLIVFLSSSAIASFFHNPAANSVISIMSISIIILAFGNVQMAMLQKQMDFKSVFYRQIAPVIVQVAVTLPLASLGYGVWALVSGKLTSDFLASIILWWKSKWKPRLSFNFKENTDTIKFGLYVMGSSIMAWALIQGDNLIVGKFLSTRELGLYRTGYDLDQRILGIFITPILPVFYSKFCSFKTEESIKEYYSRIKEYISIITFPLMGGIILISPYFENLILGEKWEGISFVMALLTITGISNLWALLDSLFKSLGKPQIITKIRLIIVCIYIPLWLFFVQFGLKTFLIARVFIAIIALSINTYFENKELKINLFQALSFHYKAFFASIGMYIVGFCYQNFLFRNNYDLSTLISLIIISIITYFFLICTFSKEQVLYLKELLVKEGFVKKHGAYLSKQQPFE